MLFLGCLGAILGLGGCKKAVEEEAPAKVSVTVALAVRGTIANLIDAAGSLEPPPGLDVKLASPSAGRLAQVFVAEGDAIKAGQLLARLEPLPLRDALQQASAQLQQARAQQTNARVKRERAEKAVEAGVAARQEADDARLQEETALASVRAAEAQVSTAKNQLDRSELRAPFAGGVARVLAAPGESVEAGRPIIEVARTTQLELRAPVAPRLAALLRRGQEAELRIDGLPGRSFPAQVIAVAPVLDPATGAATVRLRVDNPQGVLKGGAFARARIVADRHTDALLVPRGALLAADPSAAEPAPEAAPHAAILVVGDDSKVHRTEVELGYHDEANAEIVQGLTLGARVVSQGAYALPDGTTVQAVEAGAGARGETAVGARGEAGAVPRAETAAGARGEAGAVPRGETDAGPRGEK